MRKSDGRNWKKSRSWALGSILLPGFPWGQLHPESPCCVSYRSGLCHTPAQHCLPHPTSICLLVRSSNIHRGHLDLEEEKVVCFCFFLHGEEASGQDMSKRTQINLEVILKKIQLPKDSQTRVSC